MKLNGTTRVNIKTLHGRFAFPLQRFTSGEDYFSLTGQFPDGYTSNRLQELIAYYSNRMSYEEVQGLIARYTGERLVSDQTAHHLVVAKAAQVSHHLQSEVAATLQQGRMPAVQRRVDLYAAKQPEVLLFDDAIQVKQQKPRRDKVAPEVRSRVSTDVMLVQKPQGGFAYLTAGINARGEEIVSLEDAVKAQLMQEYGRQRGKLKIVAITDGAQAIRQRLHAIFGGEVTVILDWYHLGKKVRELMSMIAQTKPERARHLDFLCKHLWEGKTEEVLQYLGREVRAKNPAKLHELITYVEKHQVEIIDYGRRQQAGKTIGSGRMEKAVDEVIGMRQKKKGMSWSRKGSKALAVLKVAELNGQWEAIWFPERLAA